MRMPYVTLALILALPALASRLTLEGKFTYAHDVAFLGYANAASCNADGGRWTEENEGAGICVFPGSDDVIVTKDGGEYTVAEDTVTTNAHTCAFHGNAKAAADNVLVATAAGTDENGQPAPCELTLTYSDSDSLGVTLTKPAGCFGLCGMNASLAIEKATR